MDTQKYVVEINKTVGRAIQLLVLLFVVMLIAIVGKVSYWAYYPYEPLIIHEVNLLNQPRIGGKLEYEIIYTKTADIPAVVTRELVNSHAIIFPTLVSHVPVTGQNEKKGKRDSLSLEGIPPDTYYFKWSATYHVNPIRTVTISGRTSCFDLH